MNTAGRKILIVDDRAPNRDYLATLFASQSYAVNQAADGLEALKLVRLWRPDLIIADILMPTMDGYEFVRQLRQDVHLADTPVVFLTAHYSQQEARGLAESCGVFHIITKPVEPEEILFTVARALGLPGPRAAAPLQQFDADHLRLLTNTLARKADELELTNQRLASLIELGQQLASEHDPKHLLNTFCHAAARIVGADYAIIAIHREDGSGVHSVVATGKDSTIVGRISAPSAADRLMQFVMNGPAPLFVADTRERPGLPEPYVDLGTLLAAPMSSPTRRFGILCLGGLNNPAAINGHLGHLAASMAAVLAIAYENAMRYGAIERYTHQLESEVSQRRLAQEQVERLNAELEQRVAERTQELQASHERLRESERMASLGTLSAGLGHDMGNLLLPIRTRLDLMGKMPLMKDVAGHLDSIRQCVNYLQALTNGLRQLALKPDCDEGSGLCTDLIVWSQEIAPLFKSILPRNIALKIDIPAQTPPVAIARHRLTQAVFNVVNNAADALRQSREGQVTMAAAASDDGRFVRVCVSDDGPGMSEEVRRRALEPFFTTKTRGLSTGLGLSLVHGIVKSAGGSVEIQSEPGGGTSVALVLAVAGENVTSAGVSVGPKSVASISLSDSRLAAYASMFLRSLGLEVVQGDPARSDVLIWVTDPLRDKLEQAITFLSDNRARRLAIVGDSCPDWERLGAVCLGGSANPSVFREKLRQLVADSARNAPTEPAIHAELETAS